MLKRGHQRSVHSARVFYTEPLIARINVHFSFVPALGCPNLKTIATRIAYIGLFRLHSLGNLINPK